MNFRKIMNMVVFTTIVCALSIPAQKRIISKDISSREYKVEDFSGKDYVLLKKKFGDITEFYLANKRNDPDLTINGEKEKLFSFHKNDKVQLIQFSNSGEQVVFRRLKNNKKVWEMHDIKTKKVKTIESDEGNVSTASFFDYNNYLYITYPHNERSKVYLVKENNNPVFIANGISVLWSPNGKYFLLKSPLSNSLSLREKRDFGQITREEYQEQLKIQGGPKREIFRKYMIYNLKGEKLLILQDFDFVDWIQWSPDGRKIVLRERGDRGFKIVYLEGEGNNISLAKTVNFPCVEAVHGCLYPIWSPDGNKIMFKSVIEAEANQGIQEENLYILNDSSLNYYKVTDFTTNEIFGFNWLNNQTITLTGMIHTTREKIEQEIMIEY